jgi:hypothetical protein
MKDLKDFFEAVSKEKKIQQEEVDELVSTSFDDFFVKPLIEEVKHKKIYQDETISVSPIKEEIKLKRIQQEVDDLISTSFDDFFVKPLKEEKKRVIKQSKGIIKEDTSLIEKSLGLLTEPSDVKQQNDPLTPINQKFATLEDLQKHYSLFLSRIQQQLSTMGGGGETKLKFLDDIVGIATNPAAYDQKFLQYNHNIRKFEFVDPNDVGGATIVNISGITTYYQASNVDDYIGVSSDVPVTIVLPQIPSYGKKLIVKDEGNKISTYNLTVRAGIGASVENDSSVIMKVNHLSLTYFFNGQNWFLI